MFKQTFIIAALTIALILLTCAPKSAAPDDGPDDCYNRVTTSCNDRHPGKDMGDSDYRNCINDGLDWCDVNEPNTKPPLPTLSAAGRYEVKAKATE